MSRRDAFSYLRQPNPLLIDPNQTHQESEGERPPIVQAKQPLDLIPVASRKTKRNRDWDRAHQPEKVTYRGIPKRLLDTVGDLAVSLNVPRDELVRALLEYSLADLQNNRVSLVAHPKAQRMTLFPPDEAYGNRSGKAGHSSAMSWLDQAFPATRQVQAPSGKRKHGKGLPKKERWEARATFRLPVGLKEQLKEVAGEYDVPVGELVLFFLDHGLRAYQSGELRLTPSPRASGRTLFLDE